ncbi:MAG: hypothetical protein DWQ20_01635, partial [Actinobacteria bacterium]
MSGAITQLSDSRLSSLAAGRILDGFSDYMVSFRAINQRAPIRFAEMDWVGMQADAVERLDLYAGTVADVIRSIESLLGERSDDRTLWVAIKAVFSSLISDRQDWELAETFFNSITRKVFTTVGVDSAVEFVDTDFDSPPSPSREPVYVTFQKRESLNELVAGILEGASGGIEFADLDSNAREVASRIESRLSAAGGLTVV